MANKEIHYTKLGTFKCKEFEMPKTTFLNHLENLIINDNKNNYVYYYSNNDSYVIKYKNTMYQVCYSNNDKELLDELNRLCELSILFDRNRRSKKRENIIENGQRWIFNNNLDKMVYIDYLNEQYKKEHGNLIKSTLKELKGSFFEDDDKLGAKYGIRSGFLWLGSGLIGALIFGTGVTIISPIILISIFGLSTIDLLISATMYTSFKGVIMSIINILGLPIRFIKNIVKRIKDKKEHNETIYLVKKRFYLEEDANGKLDFSREYDYQSRKEIVDAGCLLVERCEKLNKKVLSIKDPSISKKMSKELKKLADTCLKDYKKALAKEEVGNFKNYYTNWLDSINARVDMVLEREKTEKEVNNQFDEMIYNIEEQKVMVKGR